MSFVTKLPLLGRNPLLRVGFLPLSSQRCASRLSAIHQGLNRSERARPQGSSPRKEIRQRPGDEPYLSPEERRRARRVARENPIEYKIRKGKKDITEEPGPPTKSRAARFMDPRDPLGGKSLVKKFKAGQLFDGLQMGDGGSREGNLQHDDFARQLSSHMSDRPGPRKFDRERRSEEPWKFGRSENTGGFERSRGDQGSRRPSRTQAPWGDSRTDRSDGPRKFERRENTDRFERSRGDQDGRPSRTRAPWEDSRTDRSDGPRKFGRGENDGGFERSRGDQDGRPSRTRTPWGDSSTDRSVRDHRSDKGRFDDSSRGFDRSRRDTREPSDSRARDQETGTTYGSERTMSFQPSGRDREPRSFSRSDRPSSTDRGSDDADDKARKPKRYEGPVSVPYTTAASQFLYGTSTVEAALRAGSRKMYKLYIYKGKGRGVRALEKDRVLADLAKSRGVRFEYLEEESLPMLNKMSDSRPHNGHVLEASPLPQLPATALEEFSEDKSRPGFQVAVGHQSSEEAQINGTSGFVRTGPGSRKPLVLVVDQVLDPGNLGAILRTASFMGVTAVAVSKKGSAPVTPVVLKASAGAAEALTMLSVESVEDFLQGSKKNGWKVFAACPPKPDSNRPQIDSIDLEKQDPLLKDPCILLVGSEGEGLSRAVRRAANVEISIPNLSGSDVVDSLNVSVATGLLCSAFLKGKAKTRWSTVSDPGALF
ncbi:hypothetical protein KVR01_011654 [Diaporthe batatas]|uniref:uncharacterized protein n=1 Tax=Diaporthe batatas TaxID=748121 RepID=UPI001D0376B1|nr:uncharacterized protein KVR01_011654 [Diaporthe batatas]KAG8158532.1 hypothetical protein KVR01_011654 [Diaporthe batatas]